MACRLLGQHAMIGAKQSKRGPLDNVFLGGFELGKGVRGKCIGAIPYSQRAVSPEILISLNLLFLLGFRFFPIEGRNLIIYCVAYANSLLYWDDI